MLKPQPRPGRPGALPALALAALALLHLGLTSRAENEIPETEKNHAAEVVDRAGSKTAGDHVSVDGLTYFSILRGSTTIFVPFEKLRSAEALAEMTTVDGVDRVEFSFAFRDGTTERGYVKARQVFFGASKLGNFQLKLRDIKAVRFVESVSAGGGQGR